MVIQQEVLPSSSFYVHTKIKSSSAFVARRRLPLLWNEMAGLFCVLYARTASKYEYSSSTPLGSM